MNRTNKFSIYFEWIDFHNILIIAFRHKKYIVIFRTVMPSPMLGLEPPPNRAIRSVNRSNRFISRYEWLQREKQNEITVH